MVEKVYLHIRWKINRWSPNGRISDFHWSIQVRSGIFNDEARPWASDAYFGIIWQINSRVNEFGHVQTRRLWLKTGMYSYWIILLKYSIVLRTDHSLILKNNILKDKALMCKMKPFLLI